jgi:integrase
MTKIGYHVFKKSKKDRSGKRFYRWYYYFYDQNGKKIQKACPKCRNRSDAESYIRTLPPLQGSGADNPEILIKHIAEIMYIPGSAHIDRRRQLGKSINIDTLKECRNYINLIIEQWGIRDLKSIETDEILNYLFTVQRSGSWKNRYLSVFKEIYIEAPRYGCKARCPDFPRFALHKKKADIFTTMELKAFLKPENFPNDMFFLFFLLSLSGGLRLGEARAVRLKQFVFNRKALIIDGFCKENGERTNYNKKGSEEDPKFRIVLLPD